jgi:uncharacterized membrane protein
LIGQPPDNAGQLIQFILFYAFSFIILISVWYGYTRTMALLHFETGGLVAANVLLLFLVSIEPYLFNQLFGTNAQLVEDVSILYAIDLGCLFLIQSILANAIVTDKHYTKENLREFKLRRNTFLISSALFFISTIPIFWSWTITITSSIVVPVRIILWLLTLLLPNFRRLWEKTHPT